MKRWLLAVFAGLLLAPPFAEGRDWRPGFGPFAQAEGQPATKDRKPFRRVERERRGGHDKQHQNRLTDEERRELHRDLDRANREIYRR